MYLKATRDMNRWMYEQYVKYFVYELGAIDHMFYPAKDVNGKGATGMDSAVFVFEDPSDYIFGEVSQSQFETKEHKRKPKL